MSMILNVGNANLKRGTNISSLHVPEHMRRRVSFGLDWVNKLFSGETNPGELVGAVPSSAILFTGTPGAGKTTMSLQIADAITAAGNIALFNTREESLFQVKMTTERLGLKSGFVCGDDELIPSFSEFDAAEKKKWKGTNSVIDHAKWLIDQHGGKKDIFVILDSLQTFNDGKYGPGDIIPASQMRVIEQMTEFCKKGHNGVYPIAVVIGQVNKDGKFAGKNGIKHAVDAHMHLFIDEDKRSDTFGERIAEVQKNRFGCSGLKMILGMKREGLYKKGEYNYSGSGE
jgi:DNA repair protein RadA/Sms